MSPVFVMASYPRSARRCSSDFRGLDTDTCPFGNLPQKDKGRWGYGLTAEKMEECRWLKPKLLAQIEYAEWTQGDHLQHSKFVGAARRQKATGRARDRCSLESLSCRSGIRPVRRDSRSTVSGLAVNPPSSRTRVEVPMNHNSPIDFELLLRRR